MIISGLKIQTPELRGATQALVTRIICDVVYMSIGKKSEFVGFGQIFSPFVDFGSAKSYKILIQIPPKNYKPRYNNLLVKRSSDPKSKYF